MTGHPADKQRGKTTITPPGIPHPDSTDRWLVPPWPADVEVVELGQHFQKFRPAIHAGSAIQAAYYSRYAAVRQRLRAAISQSPCLGSGLPNSSVL